MLEFILLVFIAFILLAIASLLWGVDSCDGINSPEWRHRQEWRGFH
jgi:hypothetical protein